MYNIVETKEAKGPMTLNELQLYSDQICAHFGMEKIPVIINRRIRRFLGFYRRGRIELAEYHGKNLSTLVHELAHHLRYDRFKKRVSGYFKMEMWPKMVFSVDEKGKEWYTAKGEPSPVYIKVGTSHGKLFKECLKDINEYQKNSHHNMTICV